MKINRATWMAAGLVVVHSVLHAAALSVALMHVMPSETLFDWLRIAVLLLGPSQGALLAMWVVLGGGKFLWRALPTVLGAAVYLWCFHKADEEWLIYTFGEAAIWCVLFLAARCTGLQLSRSIGVNQASHRFQFYIRDMFVWTTTTAVLLSAWYTVPESAFDIVDRSDVGVGLLVFTSVAGVSMFLAMAREWIVIRIALLLFVVALAAQLVNLCVASGKSFSNLTLILSLLAFWLVASFLVLRFAGYRLAWRPRPEPPPEENNAAA